ncbi:DUF692 domain-containing protein [Parahaliea mediterranea]|uniref:HvfB family MNIO-type RiPP peptide maturase n=1 Tax=Parahaliea mediterranea TaxID=651086 RepID=UPI000E2EF512|nr:DUF692 domain-containing protein [Parahaliea mediterranea]
MPGTAREIRGAGLGLRRALLGPLLSRPTGDIDFMEVAPENWIGVGGRFGRQFREIAERYPLVLHGLSLDIGGPDALDLDLLRAVRALMDELQVGFYSEHLTYCAAEGHLYDLLPIPFTEEAVGHVVARIQQAQDIIGQPLVLENASYYAQAHRDMSEAEFISAVLQRSGAELLLDVNNIYVNSINHGYDPVAFLASLPLSRVRYLHIAGHYDEADDLKVDTHGADVIDPVWALLSRAYDLLGPLPTLLERDFNLPPLPQLLQEVAEVRRRQGCALPGGRAVGEGA